MDRESVERLRFDRRLQRRRGWVEESDYSSHTESLVDVSEKMTTAAELEAEEAAAAAAAPPAPAQAAPPAYQQPPSVAVEVGEPRPSGGVAGDFSSSTPGGSTFGGGPDGTSES